MTERAPRIDFAGRWALITGGAGGLGSACARAYLAAGGNVVLADLPGDRLERVAAELRAFAAEADGELSFLGGAPGAELDAAADLPGAAAELGATADQPRAAAELGATADQPSGAAEVLASAGGRVEAIGVDLADVATCRELPHRAHAFGGRLDTLVNATGIMQTKPMAEVTADEWQRVIDINLTGVFHTVQAACGLMTEHGGSVVSIASVAARSGRPAAPAYAASKTALLSLTKSAALAYAPMVRVNAVCPGVFFTDMWRGIVEDRDREYGPGAGQRYLDEVTAKTPLKRLGKVEELADVVAFLASDLAAYITGQAVNVDGGLEMD